MKAAAALGATALWLALGLGLAPPVHASSNTAATKSALEGIAALKRGDAEQASEMLESAYRSLGLPSVGLWSARALVQRGLLVEASERYLEVSRIEAPKHEPPIQVKAREDSAAELAELTERIPKLLVTVEGANRAEVTLTLDGAFLAPAVIGEPRPINPGEHRVAAEFAGQHVEHNVTLGERETKTVALLFDTRAAHDPRPSSQPRREPAEADSASSEASANETMKVLSYVALGAGGAGLLVGGVAGFLAVREKQALDGSSACRGNQCLPSKQAEVDGFRRLRIVSTAGLVAGGVFAATGLALTLSSRSREADDSEQSALTLDIGPSSAILKGMF